MTTPSVLFVLGSPHSQWEAWFSTVVDRNDALRRMSTAGLLAWLDGEITLSGGSVQLPSEEDGGALLVSTPLTPVGATWVTVDARITTGLEVLNAVWPRVACLILVENPAVGLAAAIAAGRAKEPVLWLTHWRDGARQLLGHVRRDPSRCVLVDVAEAFRHPQALAALCVQRLGAELPPWVSDPPPPAEPEDALTRTLATALVLLDRAAWGRYLELQAACRLLLQDTAPSLSGEGPRLDWTAAVQQLHWLHAERSPVAHAVAEVAKLRALAEGDAERLERQARALIDAVAARDEQANKAAEVSRAFHELNNAFNAQFEELRAQLDAISRDARTRGEQHFLQLNESQEELESAPLARQEVEERLSGAEAAAQRMTCDISGLNGELVVAHALNTELESQAQKQLARITALEAERQALGRENARVLEALKEREIAFDGSQQALQALRRESALLVLHLHDAQAEAERQVEHCQQLELDAESTAPLPLLNRICLSELQLVQERDSTPYRELTFAVRRALVGERQVPGTTVRLVEHYGHPGLVVFGNEAGPGLLESFRPNGEEDGRPYVLLLPSDPGGRLNLDAMGSNDWELVRALVAHIEKWLRRWSVRRTPYWAQLARRLDAELRELPPRFRFATLAVDALADSDPRSIEFLFGGVQFGARLLPRLTVHWRPSGRHAGLDLLSDVEAGPPLASWPHDEHGLALPNLALHLGDVTHGHGGGSAGRKLSGGDRNFVLALLDTLPDAMAGMKRETQFVEGDKVSLAATVAALRLQLEGATRVRGRPAAGWVALTNLARQLARRPQHRTRRSD